MSVILVVENEDRYIQRIEDTLGTEGWTLQLVSSPEEALQVGAKEIPDLVLVNSDLEGVEVVYESFAKRNQGPGVIAMIPEHRAAELTAQSLGVDGLVSKPFTDQALRLEVRRGLAGSPPPAAGLTLNPGQKLTSADIFGDLVAEIQDEIAGEASPPGGAAADSASAASPPPPAMPIEAPPQEPPHSAAPPPPTPPPVAPPPAASQQATPEPAAPPPPTPPATPPPAAPPQASSDADEIERKLELTLSGVLGADLSRPPEASPSRKSRGPAPDEIDQLLSNTLSGLADKPRAKKPAAVEDPDPFAGLGLGDLVSKTGGAPRQAAPPKPQAPQAIEPTGEDLSPEAAEPPPMAADLAATQRFEPAPISPPPERPRINPPPPLNTELLEALSAESSSPGGFTPENPFAAQDDTSLESSDSEPDPRESFGQYSLLERIAVGGMAEVWKARMRGVEGFQKTVAIKKILPHLNENEEFVSMFIDEAKLAAQLSHPNIIHIYDLGKIATNYYIAMEFVDGMNLREILTTARDLGQPMDQGLALLIGARLASALDYAHRKRDFEDRDLGLVHRDVSPQNVLISQDGDIKLCDFGIAKAAAKASHTQMGALKGKIQYMSPEQAWGQAVDPRSDIFSVGTLLFEMLTGERLFSGDNEISVLEAVREALVRPPRDVNPAIDADADRIVMTALAKDPADRFQSAGQLRDALEQALYSLQPTPGPADLAAYLDRMRSPGSDTEESPSAPASAAPEVSAAVPPTPPKPQQPPTAGVDVDLERALAGELGDSARAARPVDGDSEASPSAAAAPPIAPSEPPAARSEPDPAVPDPPPPSGGSDPGLAEDPSEASPKASPVVEAMQPIDEEALEEGGGRSRKPLLLLIVALVLVGLLVFLYYRFAPRKAPEPQTPPAPVVLPIEGGEAETEPSDELLDPPPENGTLDGGEADSGDAAADEVAPQAGAAAETTLDSASSDPAADSEEDPNALADMVDQELARREEALRAKLETEQKRLEAQLREAQEATRPAPADPPPAPSQEAPTQEPVREPAGEEPTPLAARGPPAAQAAPATAEPTAQAPAQPPPEAPPTSTPSDPPTNETPVSPPAEAAPKSPPTQRGELVRVGPGVVPPKLVSIQKPEYPPIAKRMRVEGEVVLSVLVDETGKVVDTRFVERIDRNVGINEAAVQAARTAKYQPARKNDVAVKMWTTLRLPFRL